MDTDRSAQELAQQRRDVRSVALHLVSALEGGMGGTLASSSGQYRGCESAFNDQFKSFHYLAQARVDVTHDPSAGAVGGAIQEAGLAETGSRPIPGGGRSLGFTKDDLTGSVSFYPHQHYVLVDVSGTCVDVPEDQRDEWTSKDEPSPRLR